jgi:Holliday junction resolvasome RuvABC endonuclease subunit
MCVLGIDPGFASLGWATVDPQTLALIDCGVLRTESHKSTSKKVLAADDNFRRAKEIAAWFDDARFADVQLVCGEAMSFPRNASTSAKLGLCWGVLAAVCHIRSIPLTQLSPQRIKKNVTGVKNAQDATLNTALEAMYPGATELIEARVRAKTQHQHVWDALGAIHAARDSELFVLLKGRR